MSRPQLAKKLMAYLKLNNLQCPENEEEFLPDEVLATMFESKKQKVWRMLKHLLVTQKLRWVKKD